MVRFRQLSISGVGSMKKDLRDGIRILDQCSVDGSMLNARERQGPGSANSATVRRCKPCLSALRV